MAKYTVIVHTLNGGLRAKRRVPIRLDQAPSSAMALIGSEKYSLNVLIQHFTYYSSCQSSCIALKITLIIIVVGSVCTTLCRGALSAILVLIENSRLRPPPFTLSLPSTQFSLIHRAGFAQPVHRSLLACMETAAS